jgi:hypothetical protein
MLLFLGGGELHTISRIILGITKSKLKRTIVLSRNSLTTSTTRHHELFTKRTEHYDPSHKTLRENPEALQQSTLLSLLESCLRVPFVGSIWLRSTYYRPFEETTRIR